MARNMIHTRRNIFYQIFRRLFKVLHCAFDIMCHIEKSSKMPFEYTLNFPISPAKNYKQYRVTKLAWFDDLKMWSCTFFTPTQDPVLSDGSSFQNSSFRVFELALFFNELYTIFLKHIFWSNFLCSVVLVQQWAREYQKVIKNSENPCFKGR